MTTINQIMTDFANTFKGSIQPQINQITNLELTRYINTGDRVKDNALIIILNGFISVLISVIFHYLKQFYVTLKRKFLSKKTYLIDYDVVMKDMTQDKLQEQYLFKYFIRDTLATNTNDISSNILLDYVKNNNIVSKIGLDKKQPITLRQKIAFRTSEQNITNQVLESYKDENILDRDGGNASYFIPVYNYTNNNGEEEYIYLYCGALYSKCFEQLNNFVYILLKYANKNNTLNQSNPKSRYNQPLRIFEVSVDESNLSSMNTNKIGEINSNITFNSIYFDDKPDLLKWIDKFETKTMYPKGLSLTNKLGILLYGPPGTGKTGCICALANTLKRDILIIKTLSITGKLQSSLLTLINNHKSSTIIVFDEFDYILSDKNTNNNDDNDNQHYVDLLHSADTAEKKQEILKVMRESKKIKNEGIVDTRFILTLLDGLGNDSDRIIIATTNNPDKINPIFLRPGRFDVVMKLSFCSFDMFKDIVLTKFEELTDEYFETNKQRIQNILKLNITPLVLINKLVTLNSMELLLNSLSKLPKSTYNLEPQKSNL